MWLPDDPEKFSNRFKYLELAHYVESLDRVVRYQSGPKGNRKPIIVEAKDVEAFRKKYNNVGIYTSVFQYESHDLDKCARLGPLYFDLDSSDGGRVAHTEAIRLVERLRDALPESAIRMYFTGAKGFHVEAEPLCLGVAASPKLADTFRYIAGEITKELELTTIDFACYDARRIWRLPNSLHQRTALFKVPISMGELQGEFESILELAKEPRDMPAPAQEFSAKANEWYREFSYRKEIKEQNPFDRIKRFSQFGTSIVVKPYGEERVFDKEALLSGCPSVGKLYDKAKTQHHLEHLERLFLCSILTYTSEAEEFLYEILEQCTDFNPEKTQSHINDWKKRRELDIGGRPFTCGTARSYGVGCDTCELEPRERLERVGDQLIRTGEMADPSPIRKAYRQKRDEDNGNEEGFWIQMDQEEATKRLKETIEDW